MPRVPAPSRGRALRSSANTSHISHRAEIDVLARVTRTFTPIRPFGRYSPDVTDSDIHGEALKAVVSRNPEHVQGQGDFVLFDELFADDFVVLSPRHGAHPDKA